MKTSKAVLSPKVAAIGIVITLVLVLGLAGTAYSRTSLSALIAPTVTPTPPAGDVIPMHPVGDLKSLSAEVKIPVNGIINGERAQGELNAVVATNDKGESRITLTGSLLGQLAAQVGGSVVGLFTPSSVDIYKMNQGTYIVANSLLPICVKPAESADTRTLEDMSPQSLLGMLTKSDVARGKLAGQEKFGDLSVNHYVINGDAFLDAAKKSTDPKLKEFAGALWKAGDADLYVDAKGGYPLAFRGSYSGSYEPLKFQGDFGIQAALTSINQNTAITLPSACAKPITP